MADTVTAPPGDDYAARHGPERASQMLWALIAANVLVFVLWHSVGRDGVVFLAENFRVSIGAIEQGRVWTLLTSAFSHVDAEHLLFNMIGLWVFGRPVAMALGPRRLLHLYVVGALVASVGHVLWSLISGDDAAALGASGAVMAIAVVFAALYPRATLLIGFLIPVPAAIAVILFIGLDLAGVIGGPAAGPGQVAHAAHLGGALYGLVYAAIVVRPLRKRRAQRPPRSAGHEP